MTNSNYNIATTKIIGYQKKTFFLCCRKSK
jgi:hypothetical protein